MPIKKEEIGNIHGDWIVLSKEEELTKQKKRVYWLCECQKCKNKKIISGTDLRIRTPQCPFCKQENFQQSEIGNIYGKLTVIAFDYTLPDRHSVWKCQCQCGNIESILITHLRNGSRFQCKECTQKELPSQYIDETGNIYGQLKVIKYDKERSNKSAYWICQCECGNIISVKGTKLRKGQISCGCIKSKGQFKINQILTQNNINYKTEISFPDCVYEKELRFDFGIYNQNNELQYLIEYDGEQHYYYTGYGDLEENQERDEIKNQYCKNYNIPLIRIPYTHYDNLCLNDLLLKESEFIYEPIQYEKNDIK